MVLASQFSKFLLVGGFSTLLQYLILAFLVHTTGTDPVVASSIGYVLSALINYDLNYRLTFRSRVPYVGGMARFALVHAMGFLLNGMIGLVAGERYMKDGLVAAVGVHFWTDIVFHVIWGLF